MKLFIVNNKREFKKIRKIQKKRKRLSSITYLSNKKDTLLFSLKEWNDFKVFKCSAFFVGDVASEENKKTYKRHSTRLQKQLDKTNRRIEKAANKMFKGKKNV